jgi:hypothetical protein
MEHVEAALAALGPRLIVDVGIPTHCRRNHIVDSS